MNNWVDFYYFFMLGAALLLSALGLWFTWIMPGVDSWNKRFFKRYFIALTACNLSGLVEIILHYAPAPMAIVYIVLFLESLLLSLPLLMLTVLLLHCSRENIRESALLRVVGALWAVYVAVNVCAIIFSNGFSVITPDRQWFRGFLYPLIPLPMTVVMLIDLAAVLRRRKKLSHKTFISFMIAILPMTVALLIHLFVDVFPLLDMSIVLSGLAMYAIILSDQIEQDRMRQREIANQRAGIMVLQMRPHYIYNTLMSIYSLCNQDPRKARQVTKDFTDYLRKNFNAVASADPIPFTSELEHTRAYLAVEQAQYEDSLFVEYDTPHTLFRLPPLTLQPIVENAVKHGRDPYAGAFHISIRTRKTDGGSEIVVEDDGRGFDPADNGDGHIALNNIRQRLEIMCGGTLKIEPRDGGGTIVTVTVSDKAP